jgi:filamentous hemagglutinin family protein
MNARKCRFLLKLGIAPWCVFAAAVLQTLAFSPSTLAQELKPIADDTLGAESSVVTPTSPQADRIDGGAIRGANVFHSFSKFDIGEGREAYFANPSGIENILSRVTGNDASRIFGKLGVLGNANLFLINPNGIIFGRNASLDVRGSFVGTTANAIGFGNQGFFSATNPNTPALLTVNPSAFFFNQIAAAPIQNNSVATAGTAPVGGNASGLRVSDGKSLLLLGGDIQINGGRLRAYGGRVELGGLASPGTVRLQVDGNNLSLSFPDNVTRANVSLTNGASIRVEAAGGGSIAVNARNLDILGASTLSAGIGEGLGSVGAVAGDITVDATEAMRVRQLSKIQNAVGSNATGNSGNLILTTGSLFVTDGSQLNASTFGQGNAGVVFINARDRIFFDGGDAISAVNETAIGKGGDIRITTNSLSLTNGSQLLASTNGQGDAGNVIIDARDHVSFDGTPSNGYISGAFSTVNETAIGKGGDIRITTNSLSLTNGSQLQTSTNGQGDAGNVIIDARDHVSFSDSSFVSGTLFVSGAFSTVNETAIGKGGDIRITTNSLSLTNGSQLQTSTDGQGDAGNVIIDARDHVSFDGTISNGSGSGVFSTVEKTGIGKGGDIHITTESLSLINGSQLQALTNGQGDAGNVIINARERVFLDKGVAFSSVLETGRGKGGDIRITTGSLSLTNGGQLLADTNGQGDAGNVIIDARDTVSLQGVGDDGFSSLIGTYTSSEAGKGGRITVSTADFRVADGANVDARTYSSRSSGSITINANTFNATNGGQVITTTESSGQAGNITLNITQSLTLSNSDPTYADRLARFGDARFGGRVGNVGAASGLFASTNSGAEGKGGDIVVNSSKLTVQDNARIAVNSQGSGQGGNIKIQAGNLTLNNQALISAETFSSQGGNIEIGLKDILLLRQGSRISTNAGTAQQGGDGGNITINTPSGFIVAVPSENSDITANAYTGTGGRVQINAFGIYGTQFREQENPQTSDITASSQFGRNGTVELNTPEIDPNSALINLPTVPVDTELAQGCNSPNYAKSSFIITGRGGLPPNPKDILTPDAIEVDWVTLNPEIDKNSRTNISTNPNTTPPAPIVEATGWVFGPKGEVIFTAQAPTQQQNSWQTLPKCHEK